MKEGVKKIQNLLDIGKHYTDPFQHLYPDIVSRHLKGMDWYKIEDVTEILHYNFLSMTSMNSRLTIPRLQQGLLCMVDKYKHESTMFWLDLMLLEVYFLLKPCHYISSIVNQATAKQ